MNTITIKPHHLLDILKLYGKGLDVFVPDPAYGHDFYKIANQIVAHEVGCFKFTIHGDDICKPCNYNKDNSCTDYVSKTSEERKENHNQKIDSVLVDSLGLECDKIYSFEQVLTLLNQKLNCEVFKSAWSQANKEELNFRCKYTLLGLEKASQLYAG